MTTPRVSGLLALILALSGPLEASLVYYLPFDSGASASLANSGTASGTATSVTGISGATAPSASQAQFVSSLGSTWSEAFPVTGPTETNNRGGAVILPDSTGQFRLNSTTTANQMTLSTWVYWNGNSGGTITSPAGIASSMNGSTNAGWSLKINSDGKVYFGWLNPAGSGRSRVTSSSVVTAGQWINVTLAFDSTIGQPASIYINGTSVSTTGSSGDATMGTMKADSNSIAVGIAYHTSGQGRQSLNGYMDDFAMWDTALSAAQIKALNTAPAVLSGYNAGVMNGLFTAYAAQGSSIAGSLTWSYLAGFDAGGHAVGDTWLGGDGKYYLWLGGVGAGVTGLVGAAAAVPEPASAALLMGGAMAAIAFVRRPARDKK